MTKYTFDIFVNIGVLTYDVNVRDNSCLKSFLSCWCPLEEYICCCGGAFTFTPPFCANSKLPFSELRKIVTLQNSDCENRNLTKKYLHRKFTTLPNSFNHGLSSIDSLAPFDVLAPSISSGKLPTVRRGL